MKGLGRNIKYVSGKFLELLLTIYLMGTLTFIILLCLEEVDPIALIMQALPFSLLMLTFMLILIGVGFAETYCRNMVFLGSARKPAALGIIFSVQEFLLIQMVLLFALSLLARNSFVTEVIWTCPLGFCALSLAIMGVGLGVVSLSLKGHYVWVTILGFLGAFICIGLIGGASAMLTREKNVALLASYNSIWLLLVGMAVDLIGTVAYYKVVTKADLKLA